MLYPVLERPGRDYERIDATVPLPSPYRVPVTARVVLHAGDHEHEQAHAIAGARLIDVHGPICARGLERRGGTRIDRRVGPDRCGQCVRHQHGGCADAHGEALAA